MKLIFNRYTALLLGLLFLGFGILMWVRQPEPLSEVYCDTKRMSPGDTCVHSDLRDPEGNYTNSYAEEKAEQERNARQSGTVFGILCPILAAGTFAGTAYAMVRARRKPAAVAGS